MTNGALKVAGGGGAVLVAIDIGLQLFSAYPGWIQYLQAELAKRSPPQVAQSTTPSAPPAPAISQRPPVSKPSSVARRPVAKPRLVPAPRAYQPAPALDSGLAPPPAAPPAPAPVLVPQRAPEPAEIRQMVEGLAIHVSRPKVITGMSKSRLRIEFTFEAPELFDAAPHEIEIDDSVRQWVAVTDDATCYGDPNSIAKGARRAAGRRGFDIALGKPHSEQVEFVCNRWPGVSTARITVVFRKIDAKSKRWVTAELVSPHTSAW